MSDKVLKVFLEENTLLLRNSQKLLEHVSKKNQNEKFHVFLEKIKTIKINAHIMEFTNLEALCNGIEEIIMALLTKNLFFTEVLRNFIKSGLDKLQELLDYISKNNSDKVDFVRQLIVDCDRIAAGMILEGKIETESVVLEKSDPTDAVALTQQKLDFMLESFEELAVQDARLKNQVKLLKGFEKSVNESEFSRLNKNLENTIKSMEQLFRKIQKELQESKMISLNNTFMDFASKYSQHACKVNSCETDVLMDKEIHSHILLVLDLFFQNSVAYGFENVLKPEVTVSAKRNGSQIELTFSDNGNGIDFDKFRKDIIAVYPHRREEIMEMEDESVSRFLFATGMTEQETGLHRAWNEIERIKGRLRILSELGKGTTFIVTFPASLSSDSGFIIKHDEKKFFIPSNFVVETISKTEGDIISEDEKPYFMHRDQKIPVYRLSSIMTHSQSIADSRDTTVAILIIEYLELSFGLLVDEVVKFTETHVKNMPVQLSGIKEVKGVIIDEYNDLVPVLHMPELVKRFTWLRGYDLKRAEVSSRKIVKNILVVDSSSFARHILCTIFDANGFFTQAAEDGIDASEFMKTKHYDLIVTAINMPRMGGITLMENILRNRDFSNIPVILFPFESTEEEKKNFLELGAKAVIEKRDFSRNKLISIVKELLHE